MKLFWAVTVIDTSHQDHTMVESPEQERDDIDSHRDLSRYTTYNSDIVFVRINLFK